MSKLSIERVAVRSLRHLSRDYFSMTLGPWPRGRRSKPGQFVHVGLPESDLFFRRAMSIAWVEPDRDELYFIFKLFGRGPRMLSRCRKGDEVELLGPLGVPFTMPRKHDTCLLVGGGVGFPPLYFLARRMIENGRDPKTIEFFYGGRTSGEIVERTRLRKLGVRFRPVTDDGSFGEQGLVTEAVTKYLDTTPPRQPRIYSCGPGPMLKATDELARRYGIPGQVSLEAPMPCGFGVCLGCAVPLRAGGHARVCTEGPVFEIGEVKL